jgi:hypothetical protein
MFSMCSWRSSESSNATYSALIDDFTMIMCIMDVIIVIMKT